MNKTIYVYQLDSRTQKEIIDLAQKSGYQTDEINLMLNSRLCDLEDSLELKKIEAFSSKKSISSKITTIQKQLVDNESKELSNNTIPSVSK